MGSFLKLFSNSGFVTDYIDDRLVISSQSFLNYRKQQKKVYCNQTAATQRRIATFYNTFSFPFLLSIFVQSSEHYRKMSTHIDIKGKRNGPKILDEKSPAIFLTHPNALTLQYCRKHCRPPNIVKEAYLYIYHTISPTKKQ